MAQPEEEPLKHQKKQEDEKTKEKEKITFKQKIQNIKDNITIEPMLTCYVVPSMLGKLAIQTLYLDKACRVNLNFGNDVCDALIAREGNKYEKEELAVQELVAAMEGWKNILLSAIPSFLILFLGAWSDRTGKRKACVLIPIVGELLMCISNILNAYFFYEIPVQVTMFFEAFLPAITGGWIATYLGAFSYISDISSEETRTFRVGIANLCLTAGGPIGSALSGVLLNLIGYYGVFLICALLNLFSIIYGVYYIKDPERPKPEKVKLSQNKPVIRFLKDFFDVRHVKDTLTVAFKKGPNHRRTKSILVLASIAFIYGASYGEYTVRYLFTRYRFNWDALKYSYYNTFYICIHALGALISISIFSRKLQWDDSILGIISVSSKLVGGLAMAFATCSRDMYIAVALETFNATSFTALRSISSKMVSSDELGKMSSIFNLMEIVTSMVFGPIYSWVYMLTINIDAGIFYYMSTCLTVPPILIFVWFFIQQRKSNCTKTRAQELSEREASKLVTPEVLTASL